MTYNVWYAIKRNETKPNRIHLINIYKEDLALNNPHLLIFKKNPAKPNLIYSIYIY